MYLVSLDIQLLIVVIVPQYTELVYERKVEEKNQNSSEYLTKQIRLLKLLCQ